MSKDKKKQRGNKSALDIARTVSKKVGRATCDYKMIQDGDRILIAVSGGKDSLALTKVLCDRKAFVPIGYDLIAFHADMGLQKLDKPSLRSFLKKYCSAHYFKKINLSQSDKKDLSCFWCSWNRRKALFEAAKKYKCNKIALGHHKDDIIQTILLNMLFEGQISAMAPFQPMFGGELSIIRPLAYVEEKEIDEYARSCTLPVSSSKCPKSGNTKREMVAKFIDAFSKVSPNIKTNIFMSLKRIKEDYLL